MNAPIGNPGRAAYSGVLNRFLRVLILWTAAWLIVLCLKGAVLIHGAPETVAEVATWLSWLTYPPLALETLVGAILLVVFRPRNGADRSIHYPVPQRIRTTRWALYGLIVTPFAVVWIA